MIKKNQILLIHFNNYRKPKIIQVVTWKIISLEQNKDYENHQYQYNLRSLFKESISTAFNSVKNASVQTISKALFLSIVNLSVIKKLRPLS